MSFRRTEVAGQFEGRHQYTMAINTSNSSAISEDIYIDIWRAIPLSMILTLIDLATVGGNSLVILAVVYDYSLRNMATNFYVVSLAVADLMVGLFILPFSSTYEILGYWIFGKYFCVIWAMVDVLCCTASILSLVAISLDRYVAISRPMQYPRFSTPKVAGLCIFAVWFVATAISIPPIFGWQSERTDYSQCELTSGKGYVTYSASGSFYIPSIILIFVYSRIYVVAAKHTRTIKRGHIVGELRALEYDKELSKEAPPSQMFRVKTECRPSNVSSASQEPFLMDHKHRQRETLAKRLKKFTKEKRAAKTLAIVVGAFLMCWSPFFLVYLIGGVCDSCVVPDPVFKAFFWLGYCNSFLNPIIYPCLNKDFKRAFKRIFQRKYCKRYALDFYDSPRRSMRVIRASRKLRMSMPDSRSSSSPPDSPNMALTRRQSIFREMQTRRASANLPTATNQDALPRLNCEQFPLFEVEIYETSPRRPSMPAKIFTYSPVSGMSPAGDDANNGEHNCNMQQRRFDKVDEHLHYHLPFYSSYFYSEPNIANKTGLCTDGLHLTGTISKHVQSEEDLALSLLDVPRIIDGELNRTSSQYNSKNFTKEENLTDEIHNFYETRGSVDTSDSYFWDCIAQLRRKSAEARAAQKLGLCRVASCEYELCRQQSTIPGVSRSRPPLFMSLCKSSLTEPDIANAIIHLHPAMCTDKRVQTVLNNEQFLEGQVPMDIASIKTSNEPSSLHTD